MTENNVESERVADLQTQQEMLRNSIFRVQWLNYVNKETALPPFLSTQSFSDELASKLATIKVEINDSGLKTFPSSAAPCVYQTVRFDGKVRFLELPHPWPYSQLGTLIVDKWENIRTLCETSESLLAPKFIKGKKRILAYSYDNLRQVSTLENVVREDWLSLSAGSDFGKLAGRAYFSPAKILKLDIANFFPSIYTHALDWAIEGKRKKSVKTLGGEMDEAFQNVRNRRTDGIAIGPITSNIAAEIILHELDTELQKLKSENLIDFRRYVDDIHIMMKASEDEQLVINRVSLVLKKYSLVLNHSKQSVIDIPAELGGSIESKVNDFMSRQPEIIRRGSVKYLMADLHKFSQAEKNLSILRYAWPMLLSRIARQKQDEVLIEFAFEAISLLRDHPEIAPKIAKLISDHAFIEVAIRKNPSIVHILGQLLENAIYSGSTESACWLIYIHSLCGTDCTEVLFRVLCDQRLVEVRGRKAIGQCDVSNRIRWRRLPELEKSKMRQLVSPLIALSFWADSIAWERKGAGSRRLQGVEVRELMFCFYSGDPLEAGDDERTDCWSSSWPIRLQCYIEGKMRSSDLSAVEESCFPLLKNYGFSLLSELSEFPMNA